MILQPMPLTNIDDLNREHDLILNLFEKHLNTEPHKTKNKTGNRPLGLFVVKEKSVLIGTFFSAEILKIQSYSKENKVYAYAEKDGITHIISIEDTSVIDMSFMDYLLTNYIVSNKKKFYKNRILT